MSTQKELAAGVEHHQAGRYAQAARIYRRLLDANRNHVDALHLLGLAEHAQGRHAEARRLLEQAVRLSPRFAEAHGNLGLACHDAGDEAAAIGAYRQALALNPALAETWYNLGNALRGRGETAEALDAYRRALALKPLVECHHNLAEVLLEEGQGAAAVPHLRAALAAKPADAALWHRLGATLRDLGEPLEALACFHRATVLEPGLAEAHNDMGTVLKAMERVAESVLCFERAVAAKPDMLEALVNLGGALAETGRAAEAEAALAEALALRPDRPEARITLGKLYVKQGQPALAEIQFREVLQLRPDSVPALNNLAVLLGDTGRSAEAEALLARALALDPDFAEGWNNLGNLLRTQGRVIEGLNALARAVELRPAFSTAHSNFLFSLSFVDQFDQEERAELHRQWAECHAANLARLDHANLPEPHRKLRLGYVSPDFRAHACAFFLEPLLREHDRTQVEVFAYAEVGRPDEITERLRAQVDVWRSTVGMRDEEIAQRIRDDAIDIVIDLAGHTANNRLLALARKPAPVQVTWLGYPATTGLPAMDWRLTDAVAEPPGTAEHLYSEQLMRLPHSLWCYQAPGDAGEVSPLPAPGRDGQVTFGSFNSYAKIGPQVIALWARVLLAVEHSRLLMITVPGGGAQESLWAEFEALGVARERVELRDRLPRAAYLASFREADIALDPFPCNGGTTTCDALWMGLPVVALRGNTFLSRASLSVMTAAGCPEFTAGDEDEYVARCAELASDLPRLAAIRAGLRQQVASSPLTDAKAFARDMEAAYRAMWQAWCEQQAGRG